MNDSEMPRDDLERLDRWWAMSLRDLAGELHRSAMAGGAHRDHLRIVFETRLAEATVAAAEASERAARAGERTALWTRWLAIATFLLAVATFGLIVVEVAT